jgi:hypothetical protein
VNAVQTSSASPLAVTFGPFTTGQLAQYHTYRTALLVYNANILLLPRRC